MSSRKLRAGKARRALPPITTATRNEPRAARFNGLIKRSVTAVVVSGIAAAGFAAFTASAAGSTGTAFADQGLAISSIPAVQAASATDAVDVEDLAAARAEQLASSNEAITESRQAAAAEARSKQLSSGAEVVSSEIHRLKTLSKFQWPTDGSVSSVFGPRMHPILHYTRLHDGDDIGGKCGQEIWAAQSGVVTKAENGYNGGSGNNVAIDHGDINGTQVTTGYLHMESFTVKVGQKVNKGDVIGYVGNTGLSTACHLHFSLKKDGASSDPMEYIGWNKEAKTAEKETTKEN